MAVTPFNLKTLPLAKLDWDPFIPLIGPANAGVARFDGALLAIPNPAVLLSPLTTREAVLSSKIEGTHATFQEVLEYEADPARQRDKDKEEDIQEILNYRRAMAHAVQRLSTSPLSSDLIREMHKILLRGVRGKENDPGEFRTWQVHVGPSREVVKYMPPEAERVPELIANLEQYMGEREKDALVQLAIIHAQFELIHPFGDGNGRVGRILLPLFLHTKGLLSQPMLYLSEYFESNREEYYERLLMISQQKDWGGWVMFFLAALSDQTQINNEKVRQIHQLYDHKKDEIEKLTRSQFAIKTLDFIFSYPIFNGSQFTERSRIPKASTARILRSLTESGLLKVLAQGAGRRSTLYAFTELIDITG